VASVSNGDTDFNVDRNHDPQGTLKLYTDPWPVAAPLGVGPVVGRARPQRRAAPGALWLGETWAMAIGAFNDLPNYIDGVPTPDGPSQIDRTWLVGGDAIVKPLEGLRIWLAGGRFDIEASGSGPYDRSLTYWIAEVVAEGQLVSPSLAPLYLALRANGLTTGDSGRGYLLDYRYWNAAGFNLRDLNEYSAALGLRIGRYVTLRSEYAFRDVRLVRGVDPAIRAGVEDEHWFALDVGIASRCGARVARCCWARCAHWPRCARAPMRTASSPAPSRSASATCRSPRWRRSSSTSIRRASSPTRRRSACVPSRCASATRASRRRSSSSPPASRCEMANDDAIYHNVFSYSRPNDFDLRSLPAGESRTLPLRHPGVVKLYCSIHESMNATILVTPARWFAIASAAGRYAIPGIPPGRYRAVVWAERLPATEREIEIVAGQRKSLDWVIGAPAAAR
jgi:hypothetical protein